MKKAYQKISMDPYSQAGIIQHEKKEAIRLNKFISNSGYCSRREADRLIENGHVRVDGEAVGLSTKVFENQTVQVDDTIIKPNKKLVYIALNKPIGITCTTDTTIPGNISTFMNYKEMIFPIGRLDKESSGLILLTNDGDVVNKILRSENHHEKEYIVRVDKDIRHEDLETLHTGIQIYNPVTNKYQVTKRANIKQLQPRTFGIVLTEGLNRQIRRMCTALGYKVIKLERVRVMNISLNNLKAGEWRYLSEEELTTLNTSIQSRTSSM